MKYQVYIFAAMIVLASFSDVFAMQRGPEQRRERNKILTCVACAFFWMSCCIDMNKDQSGVQHRGLQDQQYNQSKKNR